MTRGEQTSLEEVARRCAGVALGQLLRRIQDPYLRLDAAQVVELARRQGLQALSCHSAMKRWDFGSEEAFFGFCNAGFGAWTQQLPEDRRSEFVQAVMRRYQSLIEATFGERHCFHFMQTDLVLAPG